MSNFPKEHEEIYFDKLIRSAKMEAILSFIYAAYNSELKYDPVTQGTEYIAELQSRVESAYNLLKINSTTEKGAGSYIGSSNQFKSQYTIGHEVCIWENSSLRLTELARKVAENRITIRKYLDIVFLNYVQPVNGKNIHILYSILCYMDANLTNSIDKGDLPLAFGVGCSKDMCNAVCHFMRGTDFFTFNHDMLNYVGKLPIKELIGFCNLKYLGVEGYEKAKTELANEKDYVKYISSDPINHDSKNGTSLKAIGGKNIVFYGAPGCGKSYRIKEELADKHVSPQNCFRTTFFPDYSNTDFVGQIIPKTFEDTELINGKEEIIRRVSYDFIPGPFTLALERSFKTDEMVYLIVEEINRGNAPAIFGDLFQLLDRNVFDGTSEYPIQNILIQRYLHLKDDDFIVLPSNLTIMATMNTSDQNVFTLDTAFKRRWSFRQISNDISSDDLHTYKKWFIPGTTITWEDFLNKVNNKILDEKVSNASSEDRRLGKYFVSTNCLTQTPESIGDCEEQGNNFAYKVLEYIWDDVCKFNQSQPDWFDTSINRTLEELIASFKKDGLAIFTSINFSE